MTKRDFINLVYREKQSGGVRFNVVLVQNEGLLFWTNGHGERCHHVLFKLRANQDQGMLRHKVKKYRRWLTLSN